MRASPHVCEQARAPACADALYYISNIQGKPTTHEEKTPLLPFPARPYIAFGVVVEVDPDLRFLVYLFLLAVVVLTLAFFFVRAFC